MSCPRAGAEAGRYFERCMRTAECLYLIIAVSSLACAAVIVLYSIYDCVSFTLHTLSHLHATRMDNYIPRREEEGGGAVWNYNSMYKWCQVHWHMFRFWAVHRRKHLARSGGSRKDEG